MLIEEKILEVANGGYDGCTFEFSDRVILLCRSELRTPKCDGVLFLIELLSQHSAESVIRSISHEDEWSRGVGCVEAARIKKSSLELIERIFTVRAPIECDILASEAIEWLRDDRKVLNELSIVVGETEE